MDFKKAAALATAWVDIVSEGKARIIREATIAKPYGWVFFYQSKDFLDNGIEAAMLVGNAPIIVNRYTSELRVTGIALGLDEYEKTLRPACLQGTPQTPSW
jgi:hypothetical protein